MLARLLASMKDENGRVRIAGFYDDVVPLTALRTARHADAPDGRRAADARVLARRHRRSARSRSTTCSRCRR